MLPNFVAKVTNDHRACLLLNGGMVLESFSALRARVIADASRDAAALFAEPVVTRKGGQIEVAWYSEQAGEPKRLDALDEDVRAVVEGKLKARLAALKPLLAADVGPLLGRALYLAGPDAILALGNEPLLVQWGILPAGVSAEDQDALDRHFAATLGPHAPFPAPRIAPRPGRAPAAAVPMPAVAASPLKDHRRLLAATGLAALGAVLLGLPGVLPRPGASGDADALAQAKAISTAMQDKIDQARAALGTAACNPDGSVTPAKDRQGQLPLPAPGPGGLPGGALQGGGLQGDMALVARRATESVVFILTCTDRAAWTARHKDDKDGGTPLPCPNPDGAGPPGDLVVDGAGSGFFVAPNRIATNTHVVQGARTVFVTSRSLGRVTRGKVEAATVKQAVADPDFAVLSVALDASPPAIPLAPSASRLQNVVAAGYPGVITHEDAQLDRLLGGDSAAAPELTTFPGFVTLTMNQNEAVSLIFSSAVIGHGNSGGPLLDLCGRAVGVNTLGWSGLAEDTGYKVNVAEGAAALGAFLDRHGIANTKAGEPCGPDVQASAAPAPAAAPGR